MKPSYTIVHTSAPTEPVRLAGLGAVTGPDCRVLTARFRQATGWDYAEMRRRGFLLARYDGTAARPWHSRREPSLFTAPLTNA